MVIIPENEFKNVVGKIVTILFWSQCAKHNSMTVKQILPRTGNINLWNSFYSPAHMKLLILCKISLEHSLCHEYSSTGWQQGKCHSCRGVNTSRLEQIGCHFADDIFKCNSLNEYLYILIQVSLKFVLEGPIDSKSSLFWVMAWCNSWLTVLTHWGRDKMAANWQTTFSNAFSWMKMFEFWLNFHWRLFWKVQLTICQHWFWTSDDAFVLNRQHIHASLSLNESLYHLTWSSNFSTLKYQSLNYVILIPTYLWLSVRLQ